ncbi:MAG: NUDIX domain-containing protein [Streptosporangiaceae bacterium]
MNDELVTTPQPYSKLLARNIAAARTRLQLRQSDLAERLRAQKIAWYPQTVSEAEQGRRAIKAVELLPLAIALETTVTVLTSPPPEMAAVTLPSGEVIGAQRITRLDGSTTWEGNRLRVAQSARQEPLIESLIAERLAEAEMLKAVRDELRRPRLAVVAAIVTSPLGVLVGRRRDGSPPWTFIAGEQDPGEQPEDTAVREVKEETSLEIAAGEIIGERDHPATGRHMIYIAGYPARGTEVIVGDEAELDDVRWVSLAEASELMRGTIYEPVREHLARELRRQPGGDDEG